MHNSLLKLPTGCVAVSRRQMLELLNSIGADNDGLHSSPRFWGRATALLPHHLQVRVEIATVRTNRRYNQRLYLKTKSSICGLLASRRDRCTIHFDPRTQLGVVNLRY